MVLWGQSSNLDLFEVISDFVPWDSSPSNYLLPSGRICWESFVGNLFEASKKQIQDTSCEPLCLMVLDEEIQLLSLSQEFHGVSFENNCLGKTQKLSWHGHDLEMSNSLQSIHVKWCDCTLHHIYTTPNYIKTSQTYFFSIGILKIIHQTTHTHQRLFRFKWFKYFGGLHPLKSLECRGLYPTLGKICEDASPGADHPAGSSGPSTLVPTEHGRLSLTKLCATVEPYEVFRQKVMPKRIFGLKKIVLREVPGAAQISRMRKNGTGKNYLRNKLG